MSLGTWTGKDGEAKAGLNLTSWKVQPMGVGRAEIDRQRNDGSPKAIGSGQSNRNLSDGEAEHALPV